MSKITSADANKASVDTLFDLAGQSLQGVEQLATLNLQAVKTLLAEFAEGSQAALSAKSPAELVEMQTAALQAAPHKALAYSQQAKAIFADVAAVQRAALEARVADVQAKFLDAINGALRNAPGSENILALVKSAVSAGNDAYEGVSKASKDVSNAVDATVIKVTEKAVNTSSALATSDA